MRTFIYRCPSTGHKVQGYTEQDAEGDHVYELVTCVVCQRVHLVNPKTGKVLGEDEE